MKITNEQLRQIIKEELGRVLQEQKGSPARMAYYDWYDEVVKKPAWSMESDLKNKRYLNYPFVADPNFDEEHGFPRSVKAHYAVAKKPNHPFHEFGKELVARIERDKAKDAKLLQTAFAGLQKEKKQYEDFQKQKTVFDKFAETGKIEKHSGGPADWKNNYSRQQWEKLVKNMEFTRERIKKTHKEFMNKIKQAYMSNDHDTANAAMDDLMDTRFDQETKRIQEQLSIIIQFYAQALQENRPVEETLYKYHQKMLNLHGEHRRKSIESQTKWWQSIKKQFQSLQQASGIK